MSSDIGTTAIAWWGAMVRSGAPLLVATCLTIACLAMDPAYPAEQGDQPAKQIINPRVVDLSLTRPGQDPVRLQIPKSYVLYDHGRKGGAQKSVTLSALWPDLTPSADQERSRMRQIAQDYAKGGPLTRFPSSLNESTIEIVAQAVPGNAAMWKTLVSKNLVSDGEWEHGLVRYRYVYRNGKPMTWPPTDYYFAPQTNGDEFVLYIHCLSRFVEGRCTGRTDLPVGLGVGFTFPRADIAEWRSFYDKIAAFVPTLIAK